jgi:hypothetical protein
MQSIHNLRVAANQYADLYLKDETLFFHLMDAEQDKYTAKEWYIIAGLAQLYANVKSGGLSRKEGLSEQELIPRRAGLYIRFC